jgi:chromosome segregation protein
LLSDSGIGREMHVIVGQGQLDAILQATPEERRGFIEEAAGVLKHRKRKEKRAAQTRDHGGQPHPAPDLTARSAASSAARTPGRGRGARLRLIADDLVQAERRHSSRARETALASLGARLTALEVEADETRPQLAAAQQRWFALTRLVERFTSTATLAGERVRLLAEDEADNAGPASGPAIPRDPDAPRLQTAVKA